MGNRAFFILKEKGETSYFTAYHGANALSPLLRLVQAKKLQVQLPGQKSIAHIFEHLDYDGKYQQARLMDADMFFCPVSPAGMKACMKNYKEHSQFEMRFILDLDDNLINLRWKNRISCSPTHGYPGRRPVRRSIQYPEPEWELHPEGLHTS